jgi:hypothetical protein
MLFQIGIDTEEDVLEIRRQVIETLKAGGTTVTNWSSEGTSVTKVQGLSLERILRETNAFLKTIDPDTYGPRVTRTTPKFY